MYIANPNEEQVTVVSSVYGCSCTCDCPEPIGGAILSGAIGISTWAGGL
ncbi:MAG: hypothetical protein KAT65_03070 [Methanophagales archaeon]|jgi:hypothetical protein|nr:hypothetical protein [Methanophagales archaeon]